MKKVRVGLIGAGYIGLVHLEILRRIVETEVVAVADSDLGRACAAATKLDIPKAYGSADELLDDPEVEVVHNCTPNNLHFTINAKAMFGAETVFVVELAYAAVVTVRGAPQEQLPVLLLVETPRLLFPFARAVIANATREGGFPPLLLHPVDFAELLRRQQIAGAAQSSATA